jgi:uncharacterized protein (DUF885 family)
MRARTLCIAGLLVACAHSSPTPQAASQPPPDHRAIERSNANAQLLLDVSARFTPEYAAREGVTGLDENIVDFAPNHEARQREAYAAALAQLQARRQGERDPLVADDLDILIDAAKREIKGSELEERLQVPYYNLPRRIFSSARALLDAQIAPERRPAALVRVRKYAGLESGYTALVTLAEAETRQGLAKGLWAPAKLEVENDLETAAPLIDGIEKLFKEYSIAGAEAPLAELHKQLEGYLEFVRAEVLPKARDDFRLPPELYAFRLIQVGVDIPPDELARRAHQAFTEYQAEMQTVAARIAAERKLPSADYRDVIKELKKTQIPDDQVLAFYQHRLSQIEDLVRAHHLLTLPSRPARIRIGTPAENAQQPAPHMIAPRLIGNHGEQGEFVLPLAVPGKTTQKYDDFNFDAAAWTLTAHEARPGHELQFSRMLENGVSLARAIFSFNSVNVEGWGLYAEAITLPFMPDEGKLISLQLRLQRAARAFVDPELQQGKWTPESARAFLQREVGLSPAFAKEEVDRFTFRSPGQATAYFYGYTRLLELRALAEKKLGSRFDQLRFHDLLLSQGLLPPDLLRKAVLAELH